MLLADIPTKFKRIWARGAGASEINPIPETAADPAASQELGFPPITATNPAAGGIPPNIKDFNGVLNNYSGWLRWVQSGAPFQYDAAFQTAIGGYARGCLIMSATTVGVWWMSTTDNNVTNPDTGGAGWIHPITDQANTWTASQTHSQPIIMNNMIGFWGKDTGGTARLMLTYDTSNYTTMLVGTGGFFRVLNIAQSVNLLTLDNSGNLNTAGSITAGTSLRANTSMSAATSIAAGTSLSAGSTINAGTDISAGASISATTSVNAGTSVNAAAGVNSYSGNITANSGRLRASYGAYQSGDPAAAAILNDFYMTYNGTYDYIYNRLPNGFVIQGYAGGTIVGADTVVFPIAFPSICVQVVAFEANPQGWAPGGIYPTIFGARDLTAATFSIYCSRWLGGSFALAPGIGFRYIAIGF